MRGQGARFLSPRWGLVFVGAVFRWLAPTGYFDYVCLRLRQSLRLKWGLERFDRGAQKGKVPFRRAWELARRGWELARRA